jgi:trimeric autotransporter adhesin
MRKLFLPPALLLILLFIVVQITVQAQTNPSAQALPFNQNFSVLTGSTTTYPAGFQGWGFGSTALSTTFNTAAPTADQALTAATNATTSGFVGDMNGKMGVLATGTNIKAICLSINTTSLNNITVSFLVATQHQVITERINELGVQYRIGTTGTFTNIVSSTYQNNLAVANTSGTGSVNPATVSFTLPAACVNQPIVQLRWIQRDVSGAGGRPSFSIDDIAISGSTILSSNADLSSLVLSSGSLVPAFGSATINYTSSVPNVVSAITVTPTSADANSTITVNGNAVISGNPSASITLNVGTNVITTIVTAQDNTTTKTYTITVTRQAAGVAALTLTSSLPDFGAVCINTEAGPNSFTIDGTDLDGSNISLAALSGFTYAETVGGTYTSTLNFSYTAPGFTNKQIFVKFNPTTVQSYNGNISLTGGNIASPFNIVAVGNGVNTLPAVTTNASLSVSPTTGTPAATITVTGCAAITQYGIEYSTTTGFPDGTGIKVPASNLNTGNFSVVITNLAPNTRYYYKGYVIANSVATYGLQQAFTCTTLPVPMALQPGLSYTEDFANISDWSNFFILGGGANHFNGLSSNTTPPATPGLIPGATILTASTGSFQTNATGIPPAITSGGVQRGTDQLAPLSPTQSIILLSTGSQSSGNPDNSSSAAIDFYLDFTGVKAGTLSFDFATLNNSTGNRPGSMRVYASINGTTFTELTGAAVLDFINNVPVSGSKNNIQLPANFDNSATARLRFYYHNGTTNSGSGSRPKISIDNIHITALPNVPCTAPTAAPTNLTFDTITDVSIQGSFTAAAPAPDHYLVIRSTSSTLSGNPVDGTNYAAGDALGGGTIVSYDVTTNFTATGLSPLTTYYFFVFSVNGVCTGGPLYYTPTILSASTTTLAPPPNCTAPALQPTNIVFGTTTINSIQASFTATTADEYLVLKSTLATLSNTPVDAQVYNSGDILGNAIVVQRSSATAFTATGLLPNTQYYFFIFSIKSLACVNGPAYNIISPLTSSQTTQPLPACVTPTAQPTVLFLTASSTVITGSFTAAANADNYLVIRSTSPTLSGTPVDNTDYNLGDNLGGGIVISNSASTSIITNNLTPNTTYYFFVFAANKNCAGGTKYNTTNPLTGNKTTTNVIANNIYFGNFHSHTSFSDGSSTPALAYDFAQNSECMDYLGISEHNHSLAGTSLANYHLGVTAATNYNTSHTNFTALYGMEWGTIGSGGHVLIYGDGMDNLWGWESGNYDEFVPVGTYLGSTGLFKKVIDNIGTTTFASLAHPDFAHFSNIVNTYDAQADDAIVGTAVESGPAFSTNTTYTNPSSMSYLLYYQTMLSKGYHLGPTIDHDNHEVTFGRATRARTAVVAPVLNKTEIVKAMRNMHFYATEDCDSKVDFTINTKILGSIMADAYAPNILVTLFDGPITTPAPTGTAIIRVMYGVPGSSVLPVKIDSVIGTTLSFTDNNLPDLATGYYYVDITTANGSSIITAPIWYTRNDALIVLSVKLNSFEVQKIDNSAKLSWSTNEEINSSHFIVERSVDGRIWNAIATISAAGNSSTLHNYNVYDNAPMRGINYYRLKQVDKDAKYNYSDIKKALFNSTYTAEVVPNPASNIINLYISKTGSQQATIQVLNANGKIVYSTISTQSHVQINTDGLGKGLCFVKVVDAENTTTIKVLVQ